MNFPATALNIHQYPLLPNPISHGHPFNEASQTTGPQVALSTRPDQFEASTRMVHILVADDDAAILHLLDRVLSSAGYRVSCAIDGEAAWDSLCKERFDILVTDHDMPRLTGLNLLRRVRSNSCDFPVLFVSGQMPWDEPEFPSLLEPGLALEKPFTFAALLANISTLLNRVKNDEPPSDRQSAVSHAA